MELRTLRTFVEVATRGRFRDAAEALYVSQPTATAHVQALERELGAPLFERRGRALALTAAGERLLPHARAALDSAADGLRAVRTWQAGYDERLRVVASIFVAATVLPAALHALMRERPRLEMVLHTGFSAEVVAAVEDGRADLGLSRAQPTAGQLACRRLYEEPVVAVAPSGWGARAVSDVVGSILFSDNHPGYWSRLLEQLAAAGVKVRAVSVGQVEVTRALVEEGVGWSILPRSAVAEALAAGRLAALSLPGGVRAPTVATWALWPAAAGLPASGDRLLAHVLEVVCEHGWA